MGIVKALTYRSRSYRIFDMSHPISREELLDCIDTTRYTPSSVNLQPLVYKLSCDAETNAQVRPFTFWARLLPDYDGPDEEHSPTAYVAICTDKRIAPNAERFDRDVGIAAQTILLSAVEKGYGGCMIGNFDKEGITRVLAIPEDYDLRLVVALGRPAEEIELEVLLPGQPSAYYRDRNGCHHVPKRRLEDIVL